MDADTVYKRKIGKRLTDKVVTAFEEGTLPSGDVSYLAKYIRGSLADAKDSSEVLTFLLQLAEDWPMFASIINEPKNALARQLQQPIHPVARGGSFA